MKTEYNFESIEIIDKRPAAICEILIINVYRITLSNHYNPLMKVEIITTAESISGQKILDKINNKEQFLISIE